MKISIVAISAISLLFIYCNRYSDNSSSCMENPDAEGKLIVIIGEKIEIKEIEPWVDTLMLMSDFRFIAHYQVLQKICGDYNKDTITFTVFDHYGFPAFGNYQHAMLFLTNREGKIYHEKYQYFPLYKTIDGRWASSYSTGDYYDNSDQKTKVKPEKIEFAEEVSYSIEGLTRTTTQRWFPEPYYEIDKQNKKAIAVWGNYVPELFQLKKDGDLRARGFFGKMDSLLPELKELEKSEALNLSKKDSIQLLTIWRSLLRAIKTSDTSAIERLSIDSVYCSVCEGMPRESYEDNLESINMFIDSANTNFQKTALWNLFATNKFKLSVTRYPDRKPETFLLKENENLIIYEISFRTVVKIRGFTYIQYYEFQFVKIDNRFRFYAMETN